MEGRLNRRSDSGRWNEWTFTLNSDSSLVLKSNEEKTEVVPLNDSPVEVRDVKFTIKKNVFEVSAGKKTVVASAPSREEKEEWIQAIEKAAGISNQRGQKKDTKSVGRSKVLDLQKNLDLGNILLGGLGGSNGSDAAKRLQEKLQGNVRIASISNKGVCVVCEKPVIKTEEVIVEGRVMHQSCQKCATSEEKKDEEEDNKANKELKHTATLSRPVMRKNRGKPKKGKRVVRKPTKTIVPDEEKMSHAQSFSLYVEPDMLFNFHTASLKSKSEWCTKIVNVIEMKRLAEELRRAQKVDMMSAIQCKLDMESFEKTHSFSTEGFLEMKKENKWKTYYGVLTLENGLKLFHQKNGEKPSRVFTFDEPTVIRSLDNGSIIQIIQENQPIGSIDQKSEELNVTKTDDRANKQTTELAIEATSPDKFISSTEEDDGVEAISSNSSTKLSRKGLDMNVSAKDSGSAELPTNQEDNINMPDRQSQEDKTDDNKVNTKKKNRHKSRRKSRDSVSTCVGIQNSGCQIL